MTEHKSSFRKLVEISDKVCREELGGYYIVSESRMNNLLKCLEDGAKILNQQAAQIESLESSVRKYEEQYEN